MFNKKTLLALLIAILIGILVTITTVAIMTGISERTNTLYIGSQTIEITEDKFDVKPGQILTAYKTIDKNPTIVNTGTTSCYVRVYLGYSNNSVIDGISIDANESWVLENDGYYYYQNPIKPNEKVEFFDKVTIQNTTEIKGNIYIYSESVNAENRTLTEAWKGF